MNVPEAMAQYMHSRQIPESALDEGGELPLVFDRRLRVRLAPLAGGALLLESRVGPVPEGPRERERSIEQALRVAGGRLQGHREALSLSADAQSYRLQTRLAPQATSADLESALESHVNALTFWRGALA